MQHHVIMIIITLNGFVCTNLISDMASTSMTVY